MGRVGECGEQESRRAGERRSKQADVASRAGMSRVRVGVVCAWGRDWCERQGDGTRDDKPEPSLSVPIQVYLLPQFLVLTLPFSLPQPNLKLFVDVQTAANMCVSQASVHVGVLMKQDAVDVVESIG